MYKNLLQKLTIVIFSYNRHRLLKRSAKYWSNYNVKILILDGSSIKLDDPCLKSKNIKYIHDPRTLHERLLSSPNYIDTEFMILACDDEFYLPSALSTCVEILSKDLSFSSCGGRAVGFRTKEKEIFGIRQYQKLKGLCLDNDSAYDRIFKHFNAYVPAHTYSVKRANKWKTICSHVFQKKFNFNASFEMQLEFLTMVSGKSKIISELMWMRNNEEPKVERNKNPDIESWWYHKIHEDEKKNFLFSMKKACDDLSTNQNFTLNEETISNLFEVFVKKMMKLRRKNLLRKILTLLPGKIEIKLIKFIKKFYKITLTRGDNSLVDEINALKAEGTLVNSEEIKKIISILMDSKHNDSNIY